MSQSLPDRLLSVFSWICALVLTTGVCIIIGFLILKGWRSLNLELIFADTRPLDAILLKRQVFGGLFPAMAGTFFLVILSVGIALPLGLCVPGFFWPNMRRQRPGAYSVLWWTFWPVSRQLSWACSAFPLPFFCTMFTTAEFIRVC